MRICVLLVLLVSCKAAEREPVDDDRLRDLIRETSPNAPTWFCFEITGKPGEPAAAPFAPCFRSESECSSSMEGARSDGFLTEQCRGYAAAWVGTSPEGTQKATAREQTCKALANDCRRTN